MLTENQIKIEKAFTWSRFLLLCKESKSVSKYYYCIRKYETQISFEYIEVLQLKIQRVDRLVNGLVLGNFINTSTEHKTFSVDDFVEFMKDKKFMDRKIETGFELAKKHFSKFISDTIYNSSIIHELLEMSDKVIIKSSS